MLILSHFLNQHISVFSGYLLNLLGQSALYVLQVPLSPEDSHSQKEWQKLYLNDFA